jgi:radical SAM protein with 4Fe4S-binding SPASM domain
VTRKRVPTPVRARREEDGERPIPLHAVWELTMKCDQACPHCGSRASVARPDELSTKEVFDVARQLARLGCREVALIGGEAYLRPDIHEIVALLVELGIRPVMQTGGRSLTRERARALRQAGLEAVGVSVDGPASVHDQLRGNVGSHAAAIAALNIARDEGFVVTANTQINELNRQLLRETCSELRACGIRAWQVQLTVPMGRAADRPGWIVDPWSVVAIIDTLAAIQLEAVAEANAADAADVPPFDIICGNNLGYFGPHELVMRSRPGGEMQHWGGCGAGVGTIGIESDGTIKGCPSLPTAPYDGGNVRELSLEEIWLHAEALNFARDRDGEELWGFCKSCYYADACQGGCSWMAHCALGRRGNNPFCYHRVEQLKKRGVRERLTPVDRAPQQPYDFARFELVEEPSDAPLPPGRVSLPVL